MNQRYRELDASVALLCLLILLVSVLIYHFVFLGVALTIGIVTAYRQFRQGNRRRAGIALSMWAIISCGLWLGDPMLFLLILILVLVLYVVLRFI